MHGESPRSRTHYHASPGPIQPRRRAPCEVPYLAERSGMFGRAVSSTCRFGITRLLAALRASRRGCPASCGPRSVTRSTADAGTTGVMLVCTHACGAADDDRSSLHQLFGLQNVSILPLNKTILTNYSPRGEHIDQFQNRPSCPFSVLSQVRFQ